MKVRRWHGIGSAVFVNCVAVAMFCGIPGGCSDADGRLIVAPRQVRVPYDDSAKSHDVAIRLTNHTARSVTVKAVRVSCSCTVPKRADPLLVAAGESQELGLTVTPPAFGDTDVTVELLTDSENQPRITVTLAVEGAEIEPPLVQFQTPVLEVSGSEPGEELRGEVEIRTWERSGSSLWVTSLQSVHPQIEVVAVGDVEEHQLTNRLVERTCRFLVTASCPQSGAVNGRLTPSLRDDGRDASSKVTRVSMMCCPRLLVTPSELVVDEASASRDQRILILSPERHVFDVGEICAVRNGTEWNCSAEQLEHADGRCVIAVRLPDEFTGPFDEGAEGNAFLRITTSLEGARTLMVPLVPR